MITMPRPVPVEPTEFLETELVCPTHNLTYHAHVIRCPECADEDRPPPELP